MNRGSLSVGILLAALTLLCAGQLILPVSTVETARVYVCLLELAVIVAVFLSARDEGEDSGQVANGVAGLLFLWGLAASVSVVLAARPYPAIIRQVEWFCHILFGLAVWGLVSARPERASAVLSAIVAGILLTICHIAFTYLGASDAGTRPWDWSLPIFGHVRHLGYYALAGLLLSQRALVDRKAGRFAQAFAVVASVSCWTTLVWTGGRGAVLVAIVGLLGIWTIGPGARRRRAAVAGVGSMVAGASISTLFPTDVGVMGLRGLLRGFMGGVTAEQAASGRFEIWSRTADAIREHALFGLGPDGYLYLADKGNGTHPHNLLLQFLAEWGAVGTVLALCLLAVLLVAGFRGLRVKSLPGHAERLVAYAVLVAFTLGSLLDGLYYHAAPLAILAASGAIVFLPASKSPAGSRGRRLRLPAMGLAAVCTVAMLSQSALLINQLGLSTPAAHSFRAEIVRVLPTSTAGVAGWIRDWRRTDKWTSIEWAHWAHEHAANAYLFKTIEAGLLAEVGMPIQARQHAMAALKEAPTATAAKLSLSLGELAGSD